MHLCSLQLTKYTHVACSCLRGPNTLVSFRGTRRMCVLRLGTIRHVSCTQLSQRRKSTCGLCSYVPQRSKCPYMSCGWLQRPNTHMHLTRAVICSYVSQIYCMTKLKPCCLGLCSLKLKLATNEWLYYNVVLDGSTMLCIYVLVYLLTPLIFGVCCIENIP